MQLTIPAICEANSFFYALHQRGPTHKFREREEARIKKVCLLLEKKSFTMEYKSLCMECTSTAAFLNPTGGALVVFEEVNSEHT